MGRGLRRESGCKGSTSKGQVRRDLRDRETPNCFISGEKDEERSGVRGVLLEGGCWRPGGEKLP